MMGYIMGCACFKGNFQISLHFSIRIPNAHKISDKFLTPTNYSNRFQFYSKVTFSLLFSSAGKETNNAPSELAIRSSGKISMCGTLALHLVAFMIINRKHIRNYNENGAHMLETAGSVPR